MEKCKIFIASSGELTEERNAVFKFKEAVNKLHPNLHLEIVEWEMDLPSGNYGGQRIQDAINPLLEMCEVAFVLFYSKAGQFTVEELRLAEQVCKKVFVYFKTGFAASTREENKRYDAVLELKENLDAENRILYKKYGDLTQFELFFKEDLLKYLHENRPAVTIDGKALAQNTSTIGNDNQKTAVVQGNTTSGDLNLNIS